MNRSNVFLFNFALTLFTLTMPLNAKPTNNNMTTTTMTTSTTNATTGTSTTKTQPKLNYTENVIDFLIKYGYLLEKRPSKLNPNTSNKSDSTAYTIDEMETAIREYQDFMNIPTTGIIDQKTQEKLKQKRCGLPDKIPRDNLHIKMSLTSRGKRKRRDLQPIFKKKNQFQSATTKTLYWMINPKPDFRSRHRSNIWHTLEYAFNRWASVTDIVFIRGDYKQYSDILVGFYSGKHGDGAPFDGKGGVLGHASTSTSTIHLDEDEEWESKSFEMFHWLHPNNGTDLIQAALHEIGHVLGLSHDNDTLSAMTPTMQKFTHGSVYSLTDNDMMRVKASYGKCEPDKIDAIFTNKYLDGKTYIIKGPFIYQFDDVKRRVVQSYPRATTLEFFSTTFVDEAFWHTDYFLYFFDRERYYVFDTTHDPSSSRAGIYNLNMNTYNVGFRGLKHHKYIDAALVMPYQGKDTSFIFQDEYVYKWDLVDAGWHRNLIPSEKVANGWPKKISEVFPGVPDNIDTAFTWEYDGKTYFFKGKWFYIWDPVKNKADGLYGIWQWENVCNVYLCMVAPRPTYRCESWELTKENCGGCH